MWGQASFTRTSAQKTQANTGGYDCQFVEDPPDSLKCLICLLVARDPQQHGGCGKLFCKSCISIYKISRADCPHCRQPFHNTFSGTTTIFNDFKSHQEVKSLKVICGECDWKGELHALDEHVRNVCENAQVPCPNMCGVDKKILRKNLAAHIDSECPRRKLPCEKCEQKIEYKNMKRHLLNACPKRQYSCPNCEEAGCYDERTTTHLDICPKVKIRCPKCSVYFLRCVSSTHSSTCTNEPVLCKYFEIGCTVKPLRKYLRKHEEDAQLHLAIASDKVLQLTKILFAKNTIIFKITDFKDKKDNKKEFYSPHLLTSKSGYKLCVGVDPNGSDDGKGTHVSVYAHLMKGDNDDSLTWPFTGRVTVELLNQLEDKNHHKKSVTFSADEDCSERVVNAKRGVGWGWPKFIPHTELGYHHHKSCQYLKDDTIIFRVSAEAPDYKPWLECTTQTPQ